MATYIEKLQEPKTVQKLESLIGGHIMSVYRSAGFVPQCQFWLMIILYI